MQPGAEEKQPLRYNLCELRDNFRTGLAQGRGHQQTRSAAAPMILNTVGIFNNALRLFRRSSKQDRDPRYPQPYSRWRGAVVVIVLALGFIAFAAWCSILAYGFYTLLLWIAG